MVPNNISAGSTVTDKGLKEKNYRFHVFYSGPLREAWRRFRNTYSGKLQLHVDFKYANRKCINANLSDSNEVNKSIVGVRVITVMIWFVMSWNGGNFFSMS